MVDYTYLIQYKIQWSGFAKILYPYKRTYVNKVNDKEPIQFNKKLSSHGEGSNSILRFQVV